MRAVVYHRPKDIRVEDRKEPEIQDPRDAILRVTSTAICGSDLHFYIGTLPPKGEPDEKYLFLSDILPTGWSAIDWAGVKGGEAGTIQALSQAFSAVRRGGTVSIMGDYGTAYDNFPLGQIFDKGIHIHQGQATVHKYIDELMDLISQGRIVAHDIITHTLPLEEAPHAYEIFNEKKENCVKVVLKPW